MPCVAYRIYDASFIKERILITETGCWEWQLSRNPLGYGTTSKKNSGEGSAHRLSWKIFKGEIPLYMNVLHKCDNPPCCNPDHLFIGSQADNAADAMKKGRLKCDTTRAIQAKTIPEATVTEALRRVAAGHSKKLIAKDLGIHHTSIYNMINRVERKSNG